MRIALYGIGGTYNFGCEAIVRGTEKIVHSAYPNAVIDYYSYDYLNDINRLKCINVNIIPVYKNTAMSFLDKVLVKARCQHLSCILKFYWTKKYDYILSIGGDIYTLPPDNKIPGKKRYTNSLLEFGRYCHSQGIKIIIWGASVGPFESNQSVKEVFFEHFRSCISHIVVREHWSEAYLMDNGYDRVSFYCDPAFVVESETNRSPVEKENAIGINLSPLSNLYMGNDEQMDATVCRQANTIAETARHFGKKIILLPHVLSANPHDNDLIYLNHVVDRLKQHGVETELVQCNSFCEIKKQILKCDFVISARMHCAINALSSGVPVIFLSYSQKSRALCDVVYHTDKYVVPQELFNDNTFFVQFLDEVVPELLMYPIEDTIHAVQQSSYMAARVFEQV